jgi:hypothetical protein
MDDLVLGGEDFAAKIRDLAEGDRLGRKSLRALQKPPVNWGSAFATIEKLQGEPSENISQRNGDPGRELAMLIALRYEAHEFARDRRDRWSSPVRCGERRRAADLDAIGDRSSAREEV